MKPSPKKRKPTLDPVEKRPDWIRFYCMAFMHVRSSGGPIHNPHTRVLQLLIEPWQGDYEAWTVYRHQQGSRKDGKIVFRKWNREADRARFRALGDMPAPKDWDHNTNVLEMHLTIPGRWVADLEHAVEKLSVPPVTGTVLPLLRETEYQLRFWRGRQESKFSWHTTPPKGWRPLAALFKSLLQNFRHHSAGKPLGPVPKP